MNVAKKMLISSCAQNISSRFFSKVPKKRSLSERELSKHFVDWRRTRFLAGSGGDGCISMRKEAHIEYGGPDGGDGGPGGSIFLEARINIKSLEYVRPEYKGEDGVKGGKSKCTGRAGKNTVIQVPLGTVIKEDNVKLKDLDNEGDQFTVVQGGRGGKGNRNFVNSKNQSPFVASKGLPGEEKSLTLELRTMAHAGLIGFPNAGKSSLLRALSRARPKVAAYPFTTLNPHVGIVEYPDLEQVAVADIPGLISGAHKNRGLGHSFLRHIERCLCLIYVIDLSVVEPWIQLSELQNELEQYQSGLSQRPHAVIGNKIDLPQSKENLRLLQERIDLPAIPVSALEEHNIDEVKLHLRKLYDEDLQKKVKRQGVDQEDKSSSDRRERLSEMRRRII